MKRYIYSETGLSARQRLKVAKNSTDPKELRRLANDENVNVRCYIAANPNTPVEVIEKLADDEDEDIRRSAAKNLRRKL